MRQRVVGRRETLKVIQRGRAVSVYVARDANPAILSELEEHCRIHQVPIIYVDSMRELGLLCGIEVNAACAALTRGHTAATQEEGGRTGANY
nr:ribosomal L7Ae/L30e/S12e/Gadd45 family protein [Sulfobacillus harzensis]